MNKTIKILTIVLIGAFLLSACSKRRIVMHAPLIKQSESNTWANQTNIKDDVDISDLDKEGDVATVSRTIISESTPNKMERVYFSIDEYKHLAKNGNGTVKGNIFLYNAYNKRIHGANTRLYLNPITSYSKQWYHESYLGGHKMKKADSRLFNYLRFTSANTQGSFAFYGVPDGRYYLIGTVKCGVECGYSTSKNVRIATEVSIEGNQVVQKDLSRLID